MKNWHLVYWVAFTVRYLTRSGGFSPFWTPLLHFGRDSFARLGRVNAIPGAKAQTGWKDGFWADFGAEYPIPGRDFSRALGEAQSGPNHTGLVPIGPEINAQDRFE